MDDYNNRQKILIENFSELVSRFKNNIDEADRALPTPEMQEIISALIWLNACRNNSAASVYALESLAGALSKSTLETLNQFGE